jgi:DNA-binding HxlR family transcriptional regulator
MKTSKADPYNGACPSRDILQLIGSKWSMLLVCALSRGPVRTGELKRRLDGISQKMLTQTLRELERHGIVERIDYAEVPPRVEYKLTRIGRSLSELVQQIETWLTNNYSRMTCAASAFEEEERAR